MIKTNMESSIETEKSLLSELREMETGETKKFPAERSSYVKSACSQFGFEWGKKFRCSNNREDRTVSVTRVE